MNDEFSNNIQYVIRELNDFLKKKNTYDTSIPRIRTQFDMIRLNINSLESLPNITERAKRQRSLLEDIASLANTNSILINDLKQEDLERFAHCIKALFNEFQSQ